MDGYANTVRTNQGGATTGAATASLRRKQVDADLQNRLAVNQVTVDGSRKEKVAPDRVTVVQGQQAATGVLDFIKWVPRLIVTGTGPGFPLANEGRK